MLTPVLLNAQQFHGEKELFKSDHLDWCLAVTLEGKCQVHSLRAYQVRAVWAT